ncbi:phosphatase PAP2 family protein [Lactiplantibacillus sp. WILCCON 0030]|uniref:Phosphatase PAP2 family protein n=1 Tax=Lactiplantibacillus brownii TaxID=3069269 RepID=A0ABU1A7Y4_9LACO|nr:phosphatase PAP2 family protein [Lactiplantibacillus brownii]MDQ7937045.1 phosphatase PAP2 family protein [Lactiplantibacillus brownii]
MTFTTWRRRDIGMLILALAWLGWSIAVWQQAAVITWFDQAIALPLHHSPQWFQTAMVSYTHFGDPRNITMITTMIGVLLILSRESKAAVFFWINTWILAGYGNYFVKQLIQRPRPTAWRLVQIGGYSYPSGHSTTTTVLVGSLLVIAYDLLKSRQLKRWLFGLGVAIILLMMISRIVVGVHYPSDTVGGLMLGTCLTYLSLRVSQGHRRGNFKFKTHHQS